MRVIVSGGGKMVYFLAKTLSAQGHRVTILVPQSQEALTFSQLLPEASVLVGDSSDAGVLEAAEAYKADTFLALMPHDHDNLIACQIAGRVFNVPRTCALVNDPANTEIFKRLGVSVAFSATQIIANLIVQRTAFDELTQLMPFAGGGLNVAELQLREGARAIGRKLAELSLPAGAVVACCVRAGTPMPVSAEMVLSVDDRLLLVGPAEAYAPLLSALVGGMES